MKEKKSIVNAIIIALYLLFMIGLYYSTFLYDIAGTVKLGFLLPVHFIMAIYIFLDARKRKYSQGNRIGAFFTGFLFGFFGPIVWAFLIYGDIERGKKSENDEYYKIYRDSKIAILIAIIIPIVVSTVIVLITYSIINIEAEYNKRLNTYNEDILKYNSLIEQRNNVQTIDDLLLVGRKAISEYSFAKSHIDEFNDFLNKNEVDMFVDVYQMRKEINDFNILYQNFLRDIEITITDYNTETQAQRTAIEDLLRLYATLALL